MTTKKNVKIMSRFSNKILQITNGTSDAYGNSYLLVHADTHQAIVADYFSGVVYLNKHKFEVYQKTNHGERSGVFDLRTGIDWDIKTPRQLFNEAYETTKKTLIKNLKTLSPNCICQYPRILDYLNNRASTDTDLLKNLVLQYALHQKSHYYHKEKDEDIIEYECPNCYSIFKHRYRERGIDQLEIKDLKTHLVIGQSVKELAPVHLSALFNQLFYRSDYFHREHLFASTENEGEMVAYLFEKI